MIAEVIVEAAVSLGAFGLAFGAGLAIASKKFYVYVDPKEIAVNDVLPGVNCGACGYPGCGGFAHAVVVGDTEVNGCIAGGSSVTESIATVMGVAAIAKEKMVAHPMCHGGLKHAVERFDYDGIGHCKAAVLVANGFKGCTHGCLGLGSCKIACPFNAIVINDDHIPEIHPERCTGCGKCVEVCPKNIMELVNPNKNKVYIQCRSHERGKVVKSKCTVGCIGCKACHKFCPYDAVIFENNLAQIDYSKCRSCGVCAVKCKPNTILDTVPTRTKAVVIAERCTGCGACTTVCAFKAPSGEEGHVHKIDEGKCIGCGACIDKCPEKTIVRKL